MTATPAKTTITLPPARVAQLRTLAAGNDCALSEVVELLLAREVSAGRLPTFCRAIPSR